MPERPDLEYVVPILDRELRGARIVGSRLRKPVVLRALEEPLGEIASVGRRAHYAVFDLGRLTLAISPMLAGRFTLAKQGEKDPADLAMAFCLEDGRELRYRDDVQMGKVYVLASASVVPGLERVGVDVLSPAFTLTCFQTLCASRRDQVKVFLMDKTALDAMGNAYADEVLYEARLHPKRRVGSLTPSEVEALHGAIIEVLTHAREVIAERAPPLDVKLRDFLHVRGRGGVPCDRCGTKVRTVGVHGHDAFFCPKCQPDTTGRGLVDWRRLP